MLDTSVLPLWILTSQHKMVLSELNTYRFLCVYAIMPHIAQCTNTYTVVIESIQVNVGKLYANTMPFYKRALSAWRCEDGRTNPPNRHTQSHHQHHTWLSPSNPVLEVLFPKTPFKGSLVMLLCLGPWKNTDQPLPMGLTKLRLTSLERQYRARTSCQNSVWAQYIFVVIIFENLDKNNH